MHKSRERQFSGSLFGEHLHAGARTVEIFKRASFWASLWQTSLCRLAIIIVQNAAENIVSLNGAFA